MHAYISIILKTIQDELLFLYLLFFITAEVNKLKEPRYAAGCLANRYPSFLLIHGSQRFRICLPSFFLLDYSFESSFHQGLYYYQLRIGFAEILCGFLVIMNFRCAGQLFSFFTLFFVTVIHNLYLHAAKQESINKD
ncbi:unnamed protein product (macronuclear) [Paramecium tetraurelia]|uniref:Uncharacterized protein n=1 Tax=Paramecium tetraurelia TaxID=5888 RepID=A0CR97_PARTE|nr:uncharacterized protein GSPATT00009629001 [Paramecium tetraurelia]CAK73314.1 unnamed protein product [Paramecium tetraurelia]|eukprot:XP_001440711.1 hypothetical protein (macronuclear) [Paramecium tetraurelia strain d4-2]